MATNDNRVATPTEHSRIDLPKTVATGVAVYAFVAGGLTLLGWLLNSPRLTDWIGTGIAMFPNAAVCSLLSGVGLTLLARRDAGWHGAIRSLGGFVAVIGGLTLLEHLSGVNLGIDTLLSNQAWGQRAAASPMRMGPPASTSFLILGVVLVLATAGPRAR